MSVILGMAGAMLSAFLFAGGVACGWVLRGQKRGTPDPVAIPPEEKRRLKEMAMEQDAFRRMMEYNTDIAYDMRREDEGETIR